MKIMQHPINKPRDFFFVVATTTLSIITYFSFVFRYSINIPFSDDFDLFLAYINTPANDKLQILFSQHNEHRLVFSRFIAELMHQSIGYIDFRYLNIIGNIGLLIIFVIVWNIFKTTKLSLIYFAPIPILLFSSHSWTNIIWATASLQNYYVLAFSLLALFLFNKTTIGFVVSSILFSGLATYTSGSGLLLFPIIFLWFILKYFKHAHFHNIKQDMFTLKRSSYFIFIMIFVSTITIFSAYFFNYTKPGHHPSLTIALQNPSQALSYFLLFLGSYLQMKYIAIVGGMFSLISFFYLTFQQYYKENPLIYFSLLFLFANAITATITRVGFGAEEALASRYTIISVLILIFIYIALLHIHITSISTSFAHKSLIIVMVITITFSTITMLKHTPDMEHRKHALILSMDQWRSSKTGLLFSDQQLGSTLLTTALENEFYHFPKIQ